MAVARALVEAAVADMRRATAVDWSLVRRLPGGLQSGAWLIAAPGRPPRVFKVTADAEWGQQVVRASRAVAAVRQLGYPTPEWLTVGQPSARLTYHSEAFIPGATVDTVDAERARALVAVIESQQNVNPDPARNWADHIVQDRRERAELYAGLAQRSGIAGETLLDRCKQLQDGADTVTWPRTDMVHGDFRPANVIFRGEVVRGVVDIEAIGSGPRAFDYATLLSHEAIDADAVEMIVTAGASSADPRVFQACIAHVFLDLLRFVAQQPGEGDQRLADVATFLDERAATVQRLIAS